MFGGRNDINSRAPELKEEEDMDNFAFHRSSHQLFMIFAGFADKFQPPEITTA
jgi:hypothetical protein